MIGGVVGFRYWLKTPAGTRVHVAPLPAGHQKSWSTPPWRSSHQPGAVPAPVPLLESVYALDGLFEKNPPYRECLAEVNKRVSSGGTLAAGMGEAKLFTPIMITLIRVGEESGQLPLVLEQVSSYYKQKVAALAARITAMIEPCIILGMGVTVACILTAIYLPMFNMGGAVK